jgi:hypothetical protein
VDTAIIKDNRFVKSRYGKARTEALLVVTAWDVLHSQTAVLYSVWLAILL